MNAKSKAKLSKAIKASWARRRVKSEPDARMLQFARKLAQARLAELESEAKLIREVFHL